MNNKKKEDEEIRYHEIDFDKSRKIIWKKISGIWSFNKNSNDEIDRVNLKIPTPDNLTRSAIDRDVTSRTISSNHTLHGKLNQSDLSEKGHNFDTTEVEMGKLGLHQVPPSRQPQQPPESFSNVDGATLTGLKFEIRKTSFIDSILNSFKKNEIDHNSSEPHDDPVAVFFPRGHKRREATKISLIILVFGGLILGILYGVSNLSEKKEKFEAATGIKINPTVVQKTNTAPVSNVYESVNYQATGRGLVYNCRGKHWACIDKANYVKCRNLSKLASKDCVTQGVFDSNQICFATQRSNTVNSNKKDICN